MKNIKAVIIMMVLLVSLLAAAVLVQKNQETRKSAYFSKAKISILPTDINKEVGELVPVHVYVQTPDADQPDEGKVDALRTVLCYGDGSKIGFDGVEAMTEEELDDFFSERIKYADGSGMDGTIVLLNEVDGKKCVNVTFTSNKKEALLKSGGPFEVGEINFDALAAGSVTVETVPARSEVSGYNPNDPVDKAMELDTVVSQTVVTVTAGSGGGDVPPTATPTDIPDESDENTLSFKMTYLGVKKSDEHASADSWKISAVVMGGGVTKVFTNITPSKLSVVSTVAGVEMRTYRVNLPLAGFSPRQDLAVFVRGQKHIQVKYGKDGQNAFYNQTGGELDVVADKVFDFTAYPLLPGDITGPTRGVQDGKIDGRDWVFVNEEVQKRGRGEAWDVKADLDANATVNSADLSVLTQSLLERQSQLY